MASADEYSAYVEQCIALAAKELHPGDRTGSVYFKWRKHGAIWLKSWKPARITPPQSPCRWRLKLLSLIAVLSALA